MSTISTGRIQEVSKRKENIKRKGGMQGKECLMSIEQLFHSFGDVVSRESFWKIRSRGKVRPKGKAGSRGKA